MIRILISAAAYAAIGGTDIAAQRAIEGAGRYRSAPEGQVAIWLEKPVLEALKAAKGPTDSYSDVILRFAEQERRAA